MRARNIKPGFFLDEDLCDLPFAARLLFAGLWCCADREGRLEDRPRRIRATIFPYDQVDIDDLLDKLVASGHITRYESNGVNCIQINHFDKHQSPHHTEKASTLPELNGEVTVKSRKSNGGNPSDSLIPDSLIPDSPIQSNKSDELDLRTDDAGKKPDPVDEAFEEFWKACPRKEAKKDARKAFPAALKAAGSVRVLVDAMRRHTDTVWKGKEKQFIPLPASWLRGERWNDLLEVQHVGEDDFLKGAL